MRVARRSRFAAPFVLVAGCSGGPRTEPLRPPEPIALAPAIDAASDPEPSSMPADAAAPDAYVLDPEHPPKDMFPRCGGPPDPSQKGCNPPPPARLQHDARLLAISVEGGGLLITVDSGSDRGVDDRWHAQLLAGTKVLPYPLTIVRVSNRTSVLRSPGIENPRNDLRVRLTPPP